MALDFTSLKKAIASFKRSVQVACDVQKMALLDDNQKETIKAGVIQNFEFTYELSWKFMKRWLEGNVGSVYIDGVSRNELFRISAEYHLIEDVQVWFTYHENRNKTSHTYDPIIAEEVFKTAVQFLGDVQKLLVQLEVKND